MLITFNLTPEALESWGWRIPFLLAAPLGLIGLYIRSRVDDTPVFRELENKAEKSKAPLMEAIRTCGRQIFTLFGYSITNAVGYYLMSSYMIAYMTSNLAIGYTLAYVRFGGTAPFVATWLVAGVGTPLAPGFYLMGLAVLSALVVIFLFRETKQLSLRRTHVR